MATEIKKKTTTSGKRSRGRAWAVSEPGGTSLLLQERLERLVQELGSNRVAGLLGVNRSQPTRWRSGQERISADSQRRLLDLDYVMARLLQLLPREQAEIWLTSANAHLGARPIDVLRLRGAADVVAAIDVEAQGAYA